MNQLQFASAKRLLQAWANYIRSDVNQHAPKCKSPGWHKMIGVAQVYIPVNEEREEETARLMNFLKHDDYLLYVIAYQFFVEGKRHFEIADRHKFSRKSGAVSKKIAKVISYVHSRHSAGERLALAV